MMGDAMSADRKSITHEIRFNDAVVLTDVFTEAQKYRLQRHLQHVVTHTVVVPDVYEKYFIFAEKYAYFYILTYFISIRFPLMSR